MNEGKLYKKIYLHLFNKVTDALRILEDSAPNKTIAETIFLLRTAQAECEDIYIDGDDFLIEMFEDDEE